MQRGTRSVFCRGVPMQRGARFLFFGDHSMVQHGVDEGVENIYKTNVILHIFNLSARRERPASGSRRTKSAKKDLKMKVWCHRLGSQSPKMIGPPVNQNDWNASGCGGLDRQWLWVTGPTWSR